MRFLAFVALLASTVSSAGAQTSDPIAPMQYYVGTWSCVAAGEPDSKTTASYSLANGVLRDSVLVPAQGSLTKAYQLEIDSTYDAKNNRYVRTSLDNEAAWRVSFAKPFAQGAEEWVDSASSDGKLGRTQVVRADRNAFDIIGYATTEQTKPYYKVTCHRS